MKNKNMKAGEIEITKRVIGGVKARKKQAGKKQKAKALFGVSVMLFWKRLKTTVFCFSS